MKIQEDYFMGNTFAKTVTIEMRDMECATCGTPFSMPQRIWQSCYEDGGFFSCPLGHSRGWIKGNKVIKQEREEYEKRLANQMRVATEQATRAMNAEKELKKLKKRVHAGTCPCCNRTFQQLARHMKTKHHNYDV
jgi:hypothetical protein